MTALRAAAIGVVSCAAVVVWLCASELESEPRPAIDPAVAADLVAADLRARWAALEARAKTLAQMPRIIAASETDAATVRDLTDDELGFDVAVDEVVELVQRTDTLLRRPALAARLPHSPGPHIDVIEGRLRLTFVVEIATPAVRATLAVARSIAADAALPAIASRTACVFGVGDTALAIGAPFEDGVELVVGSNTLRLPTIRTGSVWRHVVRGGSIACGVLALGLLAIRRRPRVVPVTTEPVAIAPSDSVTAVIAHGSGKLGRYETVGLIGQGGTSSVYLARATGVAGFERRVAIKILRPELAQHDQARAMFMDEARLASQIDHPNVVQIYDLGRTDDGYYIAMEHVDGDDLESVLYHLSIARRHIPIPIALALVRRVCDGLHAAHTAADAYGEPMGLVHRDVKPGNVLVSRNGVVKVSDFGIAKAHEQLHRTGQGETKGTLHVMAPEQRLGKRVDARADVFGVGALAYELVTGLEIDLDLQQILSRGIVGWPHVEPLRDARRDAPVELEAILWRAMAYTPDGRHASCAELEAELAVVMDAHGWATTDRELGEWLAAELAVRAPIVPTVVHTSSAPTPNGGC